MAAKPIDRAQLFDMFEFQNMTIKEIIKELRLSQRRVSAALKEMGCNVHRYEGRQKDPECITVGKDRFRPLPPDLALKCVKQFEAGKTAKQIAKDEALGHQRVRHAIKEAGLDITQNRRASSAKRLRVNNPKHTKTPKQFEPDYAQIERLAAQGIDVFEIAYRVGNISSDAVYAHLSRLQVSA